MSPNPEIEFVKTLTLKTGFKFPDKGQIFAGKYAITGEIGRGGMGVVYKAEDIKLKRTVALKFLPTEFMRLPEARDRFIREAQAAAALSHPNICTIHEVEEADGQPYIAMEYVEGESLRQKVAKGPMTADAVADIAVQVASGLEAAHEQGIIHRDVKSANIMVTAEGQARIMDFGLAKMLGQEQLTRESMTIGTVAYMSPEQAQGEDLDKRTDIWSFGVVLYEMLTGQLPFRGERESIILHLIVKSEPKPPRQLKPDIPVEFQKIIDRALRKNRDERYGSAGEIAVDLKRFLEMRRAEEAGFFNLKSLAKRMKKPAYFIPTAAAFLAIGAFAYWRIDQASHIRWARQEIVPMLRELVEEGTMPGDVRKMTQAFDLASDVRRYIGQDKDFPELWSKCSILISIKTDPPGAKVSWKPYELPDAEWRFLGESPVEKVPVPKAFVRWKLEKSGYATVYAAASTTTGLIKIIEENPIDLVRKLDRLESLPAGMVRVAGWKTKSGNVPDYFIDECEVTNREFKEFVDAGGYQKKEFWKEPFVRNGRTLSWEEAMAEFRDATGRPGPATWQAGSYADSEANYPVAGVSWYEAAAFAEFAGKSLPTRAHWSMATGMGRELGEVAFSMLLLPLSNLSRKGPEPVGSRPGITAYGAHDMAGNVREWGWNSIEDGRCMLGAAWRQEAGVFVYPSKVPAFDRSPENGIRCVRYVDKERIPIGLFGPRNPEVYDFSNEKPFSDEVFKVYKGLFAYDKGDLGAVVENSDSSSEYWVKERVTFNAAYEGDRMIACLFLPKNAEPPYQTIMVFPGTGAMAKSTSQDIDLDTSFRQYSYLIKDGRALVYPILIGTYDRKMGYTAANTDGDETYRYVEYLTKLVKDFRRTIDYLETRPDIDASRIVYYGYSWGGPIANIISAVEERLRVCIVCVGGFPPRKVRPEASEVRYAPRVKIPFLMILGRYDLSFPYALCGLPNFNALGTPEKDKKLVTLDADHNLPLADSMREILPWLDKYLGPVKRR